MHADWPSYGPRQFFYPSNYITLGWALPAAVGAAAAPRGRPVVSVSGDGGFLMTAQELATAVRYHLPVIALVHNDSNYGAIRNIQKHAFHGRYLDTELTNPDFLAFAAAFGIPGHRAQTAEELSKAVRASLTGAVRRSSRFPIAGDSSAIWPCRRSEHRVMPELTRVFQAACPRSILLRGQLRACPETA